MAIKHITAPNLYSVPEDGKAEVVEGHIVRMSPTGFLPHYAAAEIYASLRAYAHRTRSGYAIADNAGLLVELEHRQSFSPDAAFYVGQPTGMRFLEGAPIFAVEVRRENDYGEAAEKEIAAKRDDYFAAGTLVVWDVDLLSVEVVREYRASGRQQPTIYRHSELAEAEPAVPGWSMAVDGLFPYAVQWAE